MFLNGALLLCIMVHFWIALDTNIEMLLNDKLEDMYIKLNKGNLVFYREKNSNVGVSCKGNNIIKEGNLEINNNNIVKCKLNNGIIKIIEKGE